jgi:hypothetical protein
MTQQEQDFLSSQTLRKQILREIKGDENRRRSEASLQDCEVYQGKIRPYVMKYLRSKYSETTVAETPVVASINVARKVIDQRASLYKNTPKRDFLNVSDEVKSMLKDVYERISVDTKFLQSNRLFELQQRQNHILVYPKNSELKFRVLKNHQINVIPMEDDPEVGEIYIISSFDKSLSQAREQFSNNYNEKIADEDDYKLMLERHVVWSSNLHFLMNGKGEILSEETINPIAPYCPVIEVAPDGKDFEYWNQALNSDSSNPVFKGGEVSNFTVEYNASMSALAQTVQMSSFAQAFLKAPAHLQPKQLIVGTNHILRLTTDSTAGEVEFGYATPNADLAGAQNFVLSLLSQFLSSQGIDAKTISGTAQATNFSSGVERLLAMITQFESSKESQAVYQNAEKKIFEVIKAWINVSYATDVLNEDYQFRIPEDAELSIQFVKPETVLTEAEMLVDIEKKLDLGLISRVDAIAQLEGKSIDEAKERLLEIDEAEDKPEPAVMPPVMPTEEEEEEVVPLG